MKTEAPAPTWSAVQSHVSEAQRYFESARAGTRSPLAIRAATLREAAHKFGHAATLCDDLADEMEAEEARLAERADEIRAEGG